jgi:uncharacterized membrane protein YoaK (UPF0700 family)
LSFIPDERGVNMSGLSLFHLIAFIAGLVVILLIRRRYRRISAMELAVAVVLYAILVLLFTEPVVNLVKRLLT